MWLVNEDDLVRDRCIHSLAAFKPDRVKIQVADARLALVEVLEFGQSILLKDFMFG